MNEQAKLKKSRFGHGVDAQTALDVADATLPGRFGRLFDLPAHEQTDAALPAGDVAEINARLAAIGAPGGIMSESGAADSNVPAGYTFLGQFIDHDITFDLISQLTDTITATGGLTNSRTPGLDLDSVYGGPPEVKPHNLFPYLYAQREEQDGELLTGVASENRRLFPDLPRNEENTALIGDMRNDENLVVSQLHTAFLHFHNAVVRLLKDDGHATELVQKARTVVTWYYHKLICEDFLPRTIGRDLLDTLLAQGNLFYTGDMSFMPVEFSVAAFRYGHSQVRQAYRFNSHTPEQDIFALGASALRKPETYVHWRFFFDLGGGAPPAQRGRPIDARLPDRLLQLPVLFSPNGEPLSLAARNLQRGRAFQLPSGQTVATMMAAEPALSGTVPVLSPPAGWPLTQMNETPLWFYILQEAWELGGGDHLGPVGGRIVGELLLSLMRNNPNSCLNLATPPHGVDLPNRDRFSLPDLLRVAYPEPSGRFRYTVRHRDTLSRLARRFGTTVAAIMAINPEITNPNLIFVGQRLWIPARRSDMVWPLA